MKVKIKSFNGELPKYLTEGKEYDVDCFYEDNRKYPCIYADNKHHIVLQLGDKCSHLNGGLWEIVNE